MQTREHENDGREIEFNFLDLYEKQEQKEKKKEKEEEKQEEGRAKKNQTGTEGLSRLLVSCPRDYRRQSSMMTMMLH